MNTIRRRRILVIFLVIVMAAAAAQTGVAHAALTAGKSGKTTWVYLGSGKDGKAYKSTNTNSKQLKYTVKVGSQKYVGYCVSPDKGWGRGHSMKSRTFADSKALAGLSKAKRDLLSYVLLYGYHSGKSAPYGNSNDYYAATQTLVWQVLRGHVGMDANGKWTKNNTSDKPYQLIKNHSYGVQCYKYIKKQMSDHVKGASFGKKTVEAAQSARYTLKYNAKRKAWSVTLTDKNAAMHMKASATTTGLKMSRSGNKYTFTASKAGKFTATLMADRSFGTKQAAMVFDSGNSKIQSVALGATDSKKFYVAFRTEGAGTGKIVKKDGSGAPLEGFQFKVACSSNGYSKVWTTGSDGTIAEDLYPGTYTVTEVLTEEQIQKRWIPADPAQLQVQEGKTSAVEIVNEKDTSGAIRIVKTASDGGPLEGFRFKVKGILANSERITAEEILQQAQPVYQDEEYEVGPWTIVNEEVLDSIHADAEKGITGAYVVKFSAQAERMTAEESELDETKPEVIDLNLRVTVSTDHVSSGSSEKVRKTDDGITSWDFTWNGAADIYEQEQVTNADGVIDLGGLEYGSYTIREVMSEAQQARYHQPETRSFTIDENSPEEPEPFVFENKAKEAPVRVIKKCADGQVSEITFRITGTTAWGERLTTWDEETGEPSDGFLAVTDEDGIADFGILPAGTYTAEEVDVDPDLYLEISPVEFTITGDEEEGEVITLTFENKRKSDLLVSKQDATTGSELPGASLRLTDKETGEIIDEWVSSEEPHLIGGLEFGRVVILQELLPPTKVTDEEHGFENADGDYVAGFETAEPIEITIGSAEQVVMIDELTQVVISKQDETTEEELPGAHLEILDPETGESVHQWISEEEPHMVEGLIEGKTYVLREDQAPLGFDIAEEISFTVGEDAEIVMYDNHSLVPPDGSPKTGDPIKYLPALVILCLGSLAAAALLHRKRKGF